MTCNILTVDKLQWGYNGIIIQPTILTWVGQWMYLNVCFRQTKIRRSRMLSVIYKRIEPTYDHQLTMAQVS